MPPMPCHAVLCRAVRSILLNEAYDTLMDPVGRSKYDVRLEQALTDFEDDYTGWYFVWVVFNFIFHG
jgi:hypothetical protein